jgi:glutathione peroxidase-family protein
MQHKDAGLEIMAFPCNQFGRQVCPISTYISAALAV